MITTFLSIFRLENEPGLEAAVLGCVLKSVVLLCGAGLASVTLRGAAAATRHLVWFVALVGTVLLPFLVLLTPAWSLPVLPSSNVQGTARAETEPSGDATPEHSGANFDQHSDNSQSPPATTPSGAGQVGAWLTVGTGLLFTWAFGSGAVLIYLLASLVLVARLSRSAKPIPAGPLSAVIEEVLSELDWPDAVRVCQSDRITLPMTWGIWRPVVLLPATAASWPAERQRMVLLHELAHVQRRDCLTQFVGRLAAALYWFNPLLWVALRRLRIERERACDDLVLGAGSPASEYANHLLEVARGVRTGSLVAGAAIPMAKPSQLERRLLAILDSGRPRNAITSRAVWMAWIGLLCVLVPLASVELTTAAAPARTARSEPLRYRWQPGASYVYSVAIESTDENSIETVTGNLVYTVREINENGGTLNYRSQLIPHRQYKAGHSAATMSPFGMSQFWAGARAHIFGAEPLLRLDAWGKVLESGGRSTALPQALGDVERLVFEPLSQAGRDTWEAASDCQITYETTVTLSPVSSFGRVEKKSLSAREKTSYRLGTRSGNSVEILKRYELKTQEKVSGQPRMELVGEGTITFDTAAGVPRAMQFKGTFTEATENTTLRTPLKVSYKLLDGDDRGKALQPLAPAKVEPEEMTAAEVRLTLVDLKAADWGRRHGAAAKFSRSKPSEPRTEVVNALVAVLKDSNSGVRQNAIRALGVWGGDAAVEPLVSVLEDGDFAVRWAAIEALGSTKASAAAAPLTKRLAVQQDAGMAVRALESIGSPAESAVIDALNGNSQVARREACKVLKTIGTKQSIPALEKAAADSDGLTALLAKEALKAVMERAPKS